MTEAEHQIVNRAMGRIFGMMQRQEQAGDAAEYWRCRNVILDLIGGELPEDRQPYYGRCERLASLDQS